MSTFPALNLIDIVAALLTLLIGLMMSLVPYLTAKSVVFGVRIPPQFLQYPVLKKAKKDFVLRGVIATVILTLTAFFMPKSAALFVFLLPLPLIFLYFLSYLLEHYKIAGVKRKEKWIEAAGTDGDVMEVTFASGSREPFPLIYLTPSIIMLGAIFILGAIYYPSIPASMPTHFTLSGTPNQYSGKSIFTVFTGGFVDAGVTVLLFLIAVVIWRTPLSTETAESHPAHRAEVFRHRITALLLAMPSLIGMTTLISSFETWEVLKSGVYILPLSLIPIFALVAIAIYFSLTTGQMGSRLRIEGEGMDGQPNLDTSVSHRDDDSFWKAGVLYYNKDDARLLVPKRFGVGYTLNFGHRIGIIFLILMFLAPLLVILSALLLH